LRPVRSAGGIDCWVSDLEEQRRIQKILVAIERHKKWLDVSAVQLNDLAQVV
jgi:hypothetical protein